MIKTLSERVAPYCTKASCFPCHRRGKSLYNMEYGFTTFIPPKARQTLRYFDMFGVFEETVMKFTHKHTIYACFLGYIVQAAINNFAPLLFLTFQTQYKIPLSKITMLIGFNFVVQLCVDLASAGFAERLGYRRSMLIAHLLCVAGFVALGTLPQLLPDPFAGLLIAVFLYAIGGGLLEVLVSPIVEACPSDNKEKTMSLLHSFYCWGVVAVIVLSTAFFAVFGVERWRTLAFVWTLLPIVDGVLFVFVPIEKPVAEGKGMSLSELLNNKRFFVFLVMMICAGATEMAVSQWASTLCENALGVTKALGDMCGMAGFAVFMGLSRALYGKFGEHISLGKAMSASSLLCVLAYLMIALVPSAAVGLIGCALCGFGVGILWPGTFSKSSCAIPSGGTVMFALLALAGDVGCAAGPAAAGFAADVFGGDLRGGVLCAVVFPALMSVLMLLYTKDKKKRSSE